MGRRTMCEWLHLGGPGPGRTAEVVFSYYINRELAVLHTD